MNQDRDEEGYLADIGLYKIISSKSKGYVMQHFNVFNYKFLSPTNHRGDRIAITNKRFNTRVVISWEYTKEGYSTAQQAQQYLEGLGYTVIGFSEDAGVIMVKEFSLEHK